MSVKIGQEFRRLGRCNLVVCGFAPNGKIRVYQKILIKGWGLRKTFGRKFYVGIGTTVKFSESKQREIVGSCGMDWYARNPQEVLEFTEEQLENFDAEVLAEENYKIICSNSPNGVQISRRQMRKTAVEKVLVEI